MSFPSGFGARARSAVEPSRVFLGLGHQSVELGDGGIAGVDDGRGTNERIWTLGVWVTSEPAIICSEA